MATIHKSTAPETHKPEATTWKTTTSGVLVILAGITAHLPPVVIPLVT